MKSTAHGQAIVLRQSGLPYTAIREQLGIAKSTLWRWLKAEGLVETQPQQLTELRRKARQQGSAAVRAKYLASTSALIEAAKGEIGSISRRDLWILGAALYWAEGSKQKPHHVAQRVTFTNSDPAMIRVFLAWLDQVCGIGHERVSFELYIHESADVMGARKFWESILHIPSERLRVRLKRHQLAPRRRNIGRRYVGLVRVTVAKSASLNRKIAGWIQGLSITSGESANGKPPDFGSGYPGSIPGSPAFLAEPGVEDHRLRFLLRDVNGGRYRTL